MCIRSFSKSRAQRRRFIRRPVHRRRFAPNIVALACSAAPILLAAGKIQSTARTDRRVSYASRRCARDGGENSRPIYAGVNNSGRGVGFILSLLFFSFLTASYGGVFDVSRSAFVRSDGGGRSSKRSQCSPPRGENTRARLAEARGGW